MEKYFEMVKNVYDNPQIEVTYVGNGLADEYAYNVASCLTATYPQRIIIHPCTGITNTLQRSHHVAK